MGNQTDQAPTNSESLKTSVTEVDPRIYLAAERTFLAWIRTGLAFLGFGFVVERFGLFLAEIDAVGSSLQLPSNGFSIPLGAILIWFGIVVLLVSAVRHHRYIQAIDRNEFRRAFGSAFAFSIAILLSIFALVMSVYLLKLL
jgi:putative membrane protein